MYLGFWRPVALKPAPLLGVGRKCALELSNSGQRTRRVADSGPYARIRHPQYVAFVLVMFGFLLQWPTLITLIMFPVLLIVYARLARREELDAIEAFGDAYRSYRDRTPAFIPRLR